MNTTDKFDFIFCKRVHGILYKFIYNWKISSNILINPLHYFHINDYLQNEFNIYSFTDAISFIDIATLKLKEFIYQLCYSHTSKMCVVSSYAYNEDLTIKLKDLILVPFEFKAFVHTREEILQCNVYIEKIIE